MCKETVPTLSIILPIQYHFFNVIMKQNQSDKGLIKQVKQAVSSNLKMRYNSPKQKELLCMASLLDPRFKQVPFLSGEDKLEAYRNLTIKTVAVQQKPVIKVEPESKTLEEPKLYVLPSASDLPVPAAEASASPDLSIELDDSEKPPPAKKPAMSCLLGDMYIVKVEKAKSIQDRVSDEITNYKLEEPIRTNENPLVCGKVKNTNIPFCL